jgi:heat-inducible transcriptional repressor
MHLGERKQRILGAVVREYVETVRPVGSEELAARHAWGVKSATIRNELAELAELGFLRQPHTSAGRIPSDLGYRFYVDHLMQAQSIAAAARRTAQQGDSGELDTMLRRTCTLLAKTTSYTAVATSPRPADVAIADILLAPTAVETLLLTILLSSGTVANRLLPRTADATASTIEAVWRALRENYSGRGVGSIAQTKADGGAAAALPEEARTLYKSVAQVLLSALRERVDQDEVVIEGATEIMRQPEFRESSKVEAVIEALQQGTLAFRMTAVGPHAQVSVVIGRENLVRAMQDCSIVTAPYYAGTSERGSIGVVGPTRMDYDRAVPAVKFFARALTDVLTHLSVH